MSGVIYQPPRIPNDPSNTNFNWDFFVPSKTTDGSFQYAITKAPSWTELIGKQFYWYAFSNEFYRIKY